LPGDSKVHFGFAVYEVSELEHTMNSLCHCAACQFANQGAQNLRDVHGSLQRFPCHANPTVTFSHLELQTLQITTLLIILLRIKEGEPFTAFPNVMKFLISSIGCCHETRIRQ